MFWLFEPCLRARPSLYFDGIALCSCANHRVAFVACDVTVIPIGWYKGSNGHPGILGRRQCWHRRRSCVVAVAEVAVVEIAAVAVAAAAASYIVRRGHRWNSCRIILHIKLFPSTSAATSATSKASASELLGSSIGHRVRCIVAVVRV